MTINDIHFYLITRKKKDIDSGIYKRLWIPIYFWLGAAVGNLTSKKILLPETCP